MKTSWLKIRDRLVEYLRVNRDHMPSGDFTVEYDSSLPGQVIVSWWSQAHIPLEIWTQIVKESEK